MLREENKEVGLFQQDWRPQKREEVAGRAAKKAAENQSIRCGEVKERGGPSLAAGVRPRRLRMVTMLTKVEPSLAAAIKAARG